jgi:hypothetical protein
MPLPPPTTTATFPDSPPREAVAVSAVDKELTSEE